MAKTNSTIRVDIHGMYVEDAMELLRARIERAPRGTEKIVVVHGYNRGTALKEAVRRLRSPRIVEIAPSFVNEGETVIWLRS
ncbi:MAG: Smr/MutS family protein [Bacteroidales bacterium]|nr:Smr/MutS family protein [Bacteroidales bacterium]